MELTLIPIAAVLLLLTGLSGPMRLSSAQPSSAARTRSWFSREPGPTVSCAAERGIRGSLPAQLQVPSQIAQAHAPHAVAEQARIVAGLRSRGVFRTRFGILGGAYLAQAPPRA